MKEIKSKVNIKKVRKDGYLIEIKYKDEKDGLVVTYEELEKIVLYGQVILKSPK